MHLALNPSESGISGLYWGIVLSILDWHIFTS